ncbi:hypothetical protein HanXRQr2_Chr15g0706021 [Helianthus annuus]|uniref:Uncharacterized protein n=1 Tax=Helianthus annuus TaxID=4232 RepID=A0A9K3E244_HELAN|nr:hypothetical protein HanXRQr2_Chr15g0706021 [Helianthus annuus]
MKASRRVTGDFRRNKMTPPPPSPLPPPSAAALLRLISLTLFFPALCLIDVIGSSSEGGGAV